MQTKSKNKLRRRTQNMNSLQQAIDTVNKLMENESDTGKLKEYATLNANLENAKKEHEQTAKDLKETQNSYKELILSASLTTKNERQEELGGNQGKSFEDCVTDFYKNKNKKGD